MKINACAKLNLLLNVIGKEYNGYHNIETVMMPLKLHDVLKIDILKNENNIIITSNCKELPTNEENILYKCALLFKKQFSISDGIHIDLEKNIPLSSGLGGESADAAALMHFFNEKYNLCLDESDVFYLGRLLGLGICINPFNYC